MKLFLTAVFVIFNSPFVLAGDPGLQPGCHSDVDPFSVVKGNAGDSCVIASGLNKDEDEKDDEAKVKHKGKINRALDALVDEKREDSKSLDAKILEKSGKLQAATSGSEQSKKLQTQIEDLKAKKKLDDDFIQAMANKDYRRATIKQLVDAKGCGSGINFLKNPEFKVSKGFRELGTFKTEGEAVAAEILARKSDPTLAGCDIQHIGPQDDGPKATPIAPPTRTTSLDPFYASGSVFKDNSSALTEKPQALLKDQSQEWRNFADAKTTDEFGRTITRKIKEIKVYTCASMVRNCSAENIDTWSPECKSKDMFGDEYQKYSSAKSDALEALLKSDAYKKAGSSAAKAELKMAEMKSVRESFFQGDYGKMRDNEENSWKILSDKRAEKVKQQVQTDYPGVKVVVVPGGSPDDPLNNNDIPGLQGTCGPPPEMEDSLWSKLCKKDKNMEFSCSKYSETCEKIAKKYGRTKDTIAGNYKYNDPAINTAIKTARDKSQQSQLGLNGDEQKSKSQTSFAPFRYFMAQPSFEETVVETSSSQSKEHSHYSLVCQKMTYQCQETDIEWPEFNLGPGGNGTSGKKSKSDDCPFWGSKNTFGF